jgi:hypothetical protein
MAGITLAQLAKIETNPLRKGVIMNILRKGRAMEVLPFTDVNSLKSVAVRWAHLPSVAFRKLNAGYISDESGDTEQVWEAVYGFGGDVTYDRVLKKIAGSMIVDPERLQLDMKTAAMALTFNDYLINGDHANDPDGFEGLKKRVAGMPTRQTIGFAAANAAALDPTASAAAARAFIDYLEKMHAYTNGGDHNAFFANEGILWGVGRVARYIQASGGNWLSTTQDSFERTIPTLWGSPIIDVGLKADQTTEIITETEVAGDAGQDATSIYCAAFNDEQGVTGIQLSSMEVYDPLAGGELSTAPSKMTRIDWWVGLAGFGSYGVTRGWNVEGAANWT